MPRRKKPLNPGRSSALAAIAARLRRERTIERFTQDELASAIGITRASLASYEAAINPLPFASGIAWCQRLDTNPRWLATGGEPRRPFPPFEEIGIAPDTLLQAYARRVDFLSGFQDLLAAPIERWVDENPQDKLLERAFADKSGPQKELRRMSKGDLYFRTIQKIEDARDRRDLSSEILLLDSIRFIRELINREHRESFTKRLKKRPRPPAK